MALLLRLVSTRIGFLLLYSTCQIIIICRLLILTLSVGTIALSAFSIYTMSQRPVRYSYCGADYFDNIGHIDMSDRLCYPVIDVVYTWVNGSDSQWFDEMSMYKREWKKAHNEVLENDENQAASINRFRDNGELKYIYCTLFNLYRYSLRSLEKNAPWIRHIYIVTNGQVPSWLDTRNPRISIITHKELFYNSSNLPTFSSPAIEFNLHHIPGLSEYFLYFNDDVFLGDAIYPHDLMTLHRGQYLFTSWVVPECSERCTRIAFLSYIGRYTMLGNGKCDSLCNVKQCYYDMGDCEISMISMTSGNNI